MCRRRIENLSQRERVDRLAFLHLRAGGLDRQFRSVRHRSRDAQRTVQYGLVFGRVLLRDLRWLAVVRDLRTSDLRRTMNQPTRVLMSNNYSLEVAERRWRLGDYPGQHLWGATTLRGAGCSVDYLPFSHGGVTTRLNGLICGRWGDPVSQVKALGSRADVLLAAAPNTLGALALLRRRGKYSTPLVGIVHPEVPHAPQLVGV